MWQPRAQSIQLDSRHQVFGHSHRLFVGPFRKIETPRQSDEQTPRVAADDLLRGGSRQGVSHVHEGVRQRGSAIGIERDGQFVLGHESLVAEPAEDGADTDHPEAAHLNGAQCAHAGGAQHRRPRAKRLEDLQG